MKDMSEINVILGVRVIRNWDIILLSQEQYVFKLITVLMMPTWN